MHYGKRLLTILIAATMLFTCVPSAVAAATFAEELEATAVGGTLKLKQDVAGDVTISKNVTINLNGCDITGTVTVADGCTVYVIDSQTADFTVREGRGYGKIAGFTGDLLPKSGYMQITESSGISFHRIKMELTSMTLRPDCAGVRYNGMFYGDEVVAANVQHFGIALRLDQPADARYMRTSSSWSRYSGFRSTAIGNEASGTMLRNVMRPENTDEINDAQARWRIYGSPYVLTKGGQYVFGEATGHSLMDLARAADAVWSTLTAAQKQALKDMYSTFEGVMQNWNLPNMTNKDIDVPIS